MGPIKFKECNVEFAKDQPPYSSMHAFKDVDGVVTSCWKLSWKERLHVLFHGNIWK